METSDLRNKFKEETGIAPSFANRIPYMDYILWLENKLLSGQYLSEKKSPVSKRFECLLCGRNKFSRKSPHQCVGGFRKHHIEWKEINP
jgi:hypothetical protein